MSVRERRHFSGQDKVKILRMHLLEGKPVSELCDEHKLTPSLFYQWQKAFFENGARAFEAPGTGRAEGRLEKEMEAWKPDCGASTRCFPSSWRSTCA